MTHADDTLAGPVVERWQALLEADAAKLGEFAIRLETFSPAEAYEPFWTGYNDRVNQGVRQVYKAWRERCGLRPLPDLIVPRGEGYEVWTFLIDHHFGEWVTFAQLKGLARNPGGALDRIRTRDHVERWGDDRNLGYVLEKGTTLNGKVAYRVVAL